MFDYKEYTRQRDIAQKRIKRLEKAGYKLGIHVPTVKELRSLGDEKQVTNLFTALSSYLEKGISLSAIRQREHPVMTEEQRKDRKRQQARDYRRRKVAREHEREEYPNKYQSYLKGLKTLHVDIPPSKLPAFFQYMDYRFAQGTAGLKYAFDIFVDDYVELLQKGYKPDQILADFQKFEANQAILAEHESNMLGKTAVEHGESWARFVESR